MEEEWYQSQSSKQTTEVNTIRRITRSVAFQEQQKSNVNKSQVDQSDLRLSQQKGIIRKGISKQSIPRRENPSQIRNSQKIQQKKITTQNTGQSKNFLKNTLHRLKEHIDNNFDIDRLYQEGKIESKDRSIIKSFQNWDQQRYTRTQLNKLNQSDIGRQIASRFFGNYQYIHTLIGSNKTDLDMYLRTNQKHYSRYTNEIQQDIVQECIDHHESQQYSYEWS